MEEIKEYSKENSICPTCGRKIEGDFCSNCGHRAAINYCAKCGHKLKGNYCSNCGASSNYDSIMVTVVEPEQKDIYFRLTLLSFVFPIIGFIIWVECKKDNPKKSRACEVGLKGIIILFAISIVLLILLNILFLIIQGR